MGCDIHLFVEYKKPGWDSWSNFGSQFRLGRHYGVFTSLAGVRSYGDEVKPVAQLRGIPDGIGYRTRGDYLYFVCENPNEDSNETDKERADKWVAGGSSVWSGDRHVTDPDAHSMSWLTPDEYDQAINYSLEGRVIHDREDYRALLAAMRSLEQSGYEVRTVFWFDN